MARYQAFANAPTIVTDREIPGHKGTNIVIGYIDQGKKEYCPPKLIDIIKVHFPALMEFATKPVDNVTIEGRTYSPSHQIE